MRPEDVYCRHRKRDIPALAAEPTDADDFEDDAGLADADLAPDPDADVRHFYRDLQVAAEAAESAAKAER